MAFWVKIYLSALLSFYVDVGSSQSDPNASACQWANGVFAACAGQVSGFTTQAFATQASCACYSSTAWAPGIFDAIWNSCLSGYVTVNATAYTALLSRYGTTPCLSAGNVRGISGTPVFTLTETPSLAITEAGATACASLQFIAAFCASRDGSDLLTQTNIRSLASCFCYSGRAWVPMTYDNLYSSCIGWLSTANSARYSEISSQLGTNFVLSPCSAAGDVLAGPTTLTSTSTSSSASTPSMGSSPSMSTAAPTAASTPLPSAAVKVQTPLVVSLAVLAFMVVLFSLNM